MDTLLVLRASKFQVGPEGSHMEETRRYRLPPTFALKSSTRLSFDSTSFIRYIPKQSFWTDIPNPHLKPSTMLSWVPLISYGRSFDALCGETYGYKFKFAAAPKVDSSAASSSVVQSVKNNGEDNSKSITPNHSSKSPSSSASAHVRQDQKQRRPRFAPEFDGIPLESLSTVVLVKGAAMASGTIYVTLPIVAAAAAAGICFFDRNGSKAKELEGGGNIQSSIEKIVGKAVVEVKAPQMPKLAPQFDGLECFETFVGR
ncbi:hypothetical protein FNV43_RR23845 [Rhamnella rubrinervis]|uniref:Uncharacterized protein n=1 Tax=Rhamnella rubrinervis TaxID=2594499 RepID=A0A8K0DPG9_9ROSA|nr:hypothetical protein FNV43_RR23845 [Rhamnella rubrinervis]